MADLPLLDIRTRRAWRAWLATHHGSSAGVWLVFHKEHTGVASIPYDDSVREALCVGWIDSLIKRLDDDRYARKFTPRTPASKWSDSNRRRWAELKEAGMLAPAGLAAAPTDRRYAAHPAIPELPDYIAHAFRTNAKAWSFFNELPASARRQFVGWIHMAQRPDTRERRIRESIRLLAARQRLGLK
jgi:uncharacterized protein YdeI (YjbR/CyaY-like superfamily)